MTRLEQVIAAEHVETNPLYNRDVTGDGVPEPWCNLFLERVCEEMRVPLPKGLRANEQAEWLASEAGRAAGWEKLDNAHTAQSSADAEVLVVATWINPVVHDGKRLSGHVGLLVPSNGVPGVWNAQAGRRRYSRGLITQGFGPIVPTFFANARAK